jgi:hypothetical protein
MRKLIKKYRTFLLFPRNSFHIGIGSAFNIAGNYYKFNYSKTEVEADTKVIENDWGVVGQDLQQVFNDCPVNKISSCKKPFTSM